MMARGLPRGPAMTSRSIADSILDAVDPGSEDRTADATPPRRATSADVEKHLGLVTQVVARFMRKLPANVDRGDLMAAGMYGLVMSLEKNGGDEGASFEGYAKMRIRGAILDELRAQDWLSRRARWAVNEHCESYSGPRTLVGIDDVGENERLASMIDADAPDALAALEAEGTRKEIEAAVERLPERERLVVSMHYFEGARFKDIGRLLGVSEPRVSQLHARAMMRLREILSALVAA